MARSCGPTIASTFSCARLFAMPCAHWSGEEGRAISKKRRRTRSFASLRASEIGFMNGANDTYSERFFKFLIMTITVLYFLVDVPCLFFIGLFVFRTLAFIFKNTLTRNIINKHHAFTNIDHREKPRGVCEIRC